jgi:hypothetical protein
MFEEGVEVLLKAFEGKAFSHKGRYYTIPPEVPYRGYTLKKITLVPAPERLPVECWQPIQSGSERVFDFMANWPPDIGAFVQQPNIDHRLSIGIPVHRHVRLFRFGRRQPPIGRSAC